MWKASGGLAQRRFSSSPAVPVGFPQARIPDSRHGSSPESAKKELRSGRRWPRLWHLGSELLVFSDEFAHGWGKIAGNVHDGVVRFGEGRLIFGHSFLRRPLFIVREFQAIHLAG